MPLDRLPEAAAVVRSALDEEVAARFPRVTRIPSTQAIRFLDYFAELDDGERRALLDALARGGALQFFPLPDAYDAILNMQDEPALRRYRETTRSGPYAMGLRYCDLRMTKMMLNDAQSVAMMTQTRAALTYTPRDDFPPHLVAVQDPKQWTLAKAPQLRKLLEAAFKTRFGVTKEKKPGGVLLYSGACDGTPLGIEITFTNRGPQLIYTLKFPGDVEGRRPIRFVYDALWAAGTGWDYMTEEYAPAAIDLLSELITEGVALRRRILTVLSS